MKTKIIRDIDINDVYKLIDTRSLFVGKWKFRRTKSTEEAYNKILKEKVYPKFEEWKRECEKEHILEPKIIYGFFPKDLILAKVNLNKISIKNDVVPLQIVTVGQKVIDKCQWLFASHKYADYLYLSGLAAETAEALTEYSHREILRSLGIEFNAGKKLPHLSRISPGYPVWSDLKDQNIFFELLRPERVGIQLSSNYMLIPEYSTSAMILLQMGDHFTS